MMKGSGSSSRVFVDGDGDWADQEDRGDVVEERAHDRGHDRKEDHDPDRTPFCEFRRTYCDILKETAATGGIDDDHHPEE